MLHTKYILRLRKSKNGNWTDVYAYKNEDNDFVAGRSIKRAHVFNTYAGASLVAEYLNNTLNSVGMFTCMFHVLEIKETKIA